MTEHLIEVPFAVFQIYSYHSRKVDQGEIVLFIVFMTILFEYPRL